MKGSFALIALILPALVLLCNSAFADVAHICQCSDCVDCIPSLWPEGETPPAVKAVFTGMQFDPLMNHTGLPDPPNGQEFILRRPKQNCDIGWPCTWEVWFRIDGYPDYKWIVLWRGNYGYGEANSMLRLVLWSSTGSSSIGYFDGESADYCVKSFNNEQTIGIDERGEYDVYGGSGKVYLPWDTQPSWDWIDCSTSSIDSLRDWCCLPSDAKSDLDLSPCEDRKGNLVCNPGTTYVELVPAEGKKQTIPGNVRIGDKTTFEIELYGRQGVQGDPAPADIVFVLDRSGSMATMIGSKSKLGIAEDALDKIYQYIGNEDKKNDALNSFKLGLASFNHEPQINYFMYYPTKEDPSFSGALEYYKELHACGCTGIDAGLTYAVYKNLYDWDPIGRTGLSCGDGTVNRVVILASDGMQNRDVLSEVHYPSYASTVFQELKEQFPIVSRDPNITFYSIGIGNNEPGWVPDTAWTEYLRNVAYGWGGKNGRFYFLPSVEQLYDLFKEIADIFIGTRPANSAILTVELADDFKFIGSDPLPARVAKGPANYIIAEETDIPANCVGCQIIWELHDGIETGETETISITVEAVSGSGDADVIKSGGASKLEIFNKCGNFVLNLGRVIASIRGGGNMPPTADAGADASAVDGTPISLMGSCSDSDGHIKSCLWSSDNGRCLIAQDDASDGAASESTNTGSITCTLNNPSDATVTVTLTATDDYDAQGTDEAIITLAPKPACTLAASPNEGTGQFNSALKAIFVGVAEGTSVAFDCTADGTTDGTGTVGAVIPGQASFDSCTYPEVLTTIVYTATAAGGGVSCKTSVTDNSATEPCGNGKIDAGEDCDIGPDSIPGTADDILDGCHGSCQAGCICVPTGTGGFRIASPCKITPASAEPNGSVTATVEVINDGAAADAAVELSMNGAPVGSGSSDGKIPKNGRATLSITFDVPYALEDGMYPVEVSVNDQPEQLCQTLTVFAKRPVLVPELSEFLLPLVACAVLAVLFFAGRKVGN